jgi:MscS family membrane protein
MVVPMAKDVVSDNRSQWTSSGRESRRGTCASSRTNCIATYLAGITIALLLFAGSVVRSAAQIPHAVAAAAAAAKAAPATELDPLGRETPRGTVIGFLKSTQREDYATTARYMQLYRGQEVDFPELSKEMRALYPNFQGSLNLLSDDPEGSVDPGLPPGQVRAGVVTIGSTTADITVVRVDDPVAGKIWLISKATIASIPELYALLQREAPTETSRLRLILLSGPQMLGMSGKQWLGWLISIPLSWFISWLLTFLLSLPRRIWSKLRKIPFHTVWESPVGKPLRGMIVILLHGVFVYLLQPPLLYRVYYVRFLEALLVVCFGWLLSRISDEGFNTALSRTRTHSGGGESILILMQRLNRIGILILALVAALAFLGLNVTATLTGLGIGGLAVALAAQKTLENLIGGVSLLMDRAVQVGDFCKIGDRVGTVADIGLRSLKLRTLDQNLLVVPNGLLAQMQFENMKARPKLLFQQSFFLRIETKVEQLRLVLGGVQKVLDEDPAIESGSSRIRVTNFAGAAFELELFAFATTGDFGKFTGIRQEILLKIAGVVEAAGTRFAAPTRLTYVSTDAGIDPERANDIVRHVTDLRASDGLPLPDEARTGTN